MAVCGSLLQLFPHFRKKTNNVTTFAPKARRPTFGARLATPDYPSYIFSISFVFLNSLLCDITSTVERCYLHLWWYYFWFLAFILPFLIVLALVYICFTRIWTWFDYFDSFGGCSGVFISLTTYVFPLSPWSSSLFIFGCLVKVPQLFFGLSCSLGCLYLRIYDEFIRYDFRGCTLHGLSVHNSVTIKYTLEKTLWSFQF